MEFLRYSDRLIENRYFFLRHLYLVLELGVTPSEFHYMRLLEKTTLRARKTSIFLFFK